METSKKRIGVQTYVHAGGKKTLWCSLIGHRWAQETFSGGIGDKDESVTHLLCKNYGCLWENYEFRNYPYLTDTKRVELTRELRYLVRTLDYMFDGESDEP